MLQYIEISNYALIEQLHIDFQRGMSVITGETGAGKSIIIGALSLVLGQRADTRVIAQGKAKCVVEAAFDIAGYDLRDFFDEADIDFSSPCIVRREVSDNGKSRAFVNDTPVNLNQLRDLTSRLIDIHSQHETLLLSNAGFQLSVIDTVAQTDALLTTYSQHYRSWQHSVREHREALTQAAQWLTERDYAQFQYSQLSEAGLKADEQQLLEQELDAANHTKEVQQALSVLFAALDSEAGGAVGQLKEALSALRRVTAYLPEAQGYAERVESAAIDLNDLAAETEVRLNDLEVDPERKAWLEQRLDLIYSLQQKHHVTSVEELLVIQQRFEEQIAQIDTNEAAIKELEKRIAAELAALEQSAAALTAARQAVLPELSARIAEQLRELNMPHVQFEVRMTPHDGFTPSGCDTIDFLFAVNKNQALQPIAQVASGGELSRVMLVVKSLMATNANVPTIIFDEIDTGVSGDVAGRLGAIMRRMGSAMQVVAITHLPQIAAEGDQHYRVFKSDTEAATITNIVRLNEAERVGEIAEMLSGKNPPEAAIANARELLQRAGRK